MAISRGSAAAIPAQTAGHTDGQIRPQAPRQPQASSRTQMRIRVQQADFDVGTETALLSANDEGVGAVASFLGVVRGEGVLAMTLEHYPGMTEAALEEIATQASARWPLGSICVIHRVGRLLPGERIVFVGVASSHRQAAFESCAFIMDYLKTRAPFWKKEETADGAHWVDARESDEAAAQRWVLSAD